MNLHQRGKRGAYDLFVGFPAALTLGLAAARQAPIKDILQPLTHRGTPWDM
jgi:hypothetical protein